MGQILDTILNSSGTNVAGGLLNNIVNGIAARKRQNREFKQQEKMLNLQNEFTEKMWNMENAYNNPSEQMARLVAAGINPIDAAEGVSGNAGNAASVTSSTAPSVPTISGQPLMTDNLGELFNQGRLIGTQVDAQAAQAKLLREQALTQQIENTWKPIEKYLNRETAVANLKNIAAEYQFTSARTKQINFDVDKLFPEKVRFTKAQADNMEASTKFTLGQVSKNDEEIENLKKEREEIAARIAEANQNTDLKAAEEEGVGAETQLKRDQHDLNEIDKKIRTLEEDNAKLTNQWKKNLSKLGFNPDGSYEPGSGAAKDIAAAITTAANATNSPKKSTGPSNVSQYAGIASALNKKFSGAKERYLAVQSYNKRYTNSFAKLNSRGEIEIHGIKPKNKR